MIEGAKNFVILCIVALIGFAISTPAIFALGFGIPGKCHGSNIYCYQWGAMMALAVAPLYVGFIGIFFILFPNLRKHLKYVYAAIVLLPLTATAIVIGFFSS